MGQTEQRQMSSHIILSVSNNNKWSVHVMNIVGKMHAIFSKRWTYLLITTVVGSRQTAKNEIQEEYENWMKYG